jgi:hypothetical protein
LIIGNFPRNEALDKELDLSQAELLPVAFLDNNIDSAHENLLMRICACILSHKHAKACQAAGQDLVEGRATA